MFARYLSSEVIAKQNERLLQEYWADFLRKTGRRPGTEWYECFGFGDSPALADELLALVQSGQKRATTTALPALEAEGQRHPRPGDLSLVTDSSGAPRCVIRTRAVTIQPFGAVTWQQAKREGDSASLDGWQRDHLRCFTREGRELGYTFSWEMLVVFEDFEVVWPLDLAEAQKSS